MDDFIDVRRLLQLIAIAECGSFVQAARRLGVAQPTLSKSVARLEDEVGLKLFSRSSEGAELTPAGRHLVRRGARICEESARLARETQLIGRGGLGSIRMGMGPALAGRLVPTVAVEIAKRFPDLSLSATVETRVALIAGLERGDFDMLLVSDGEDLPEDTVRTEVFCDEVFAVAAPHHPLSALARVTPEDFARHANATMGVATPFTAELLLGIPASETQVIYRSNNFGVVRALALSGVASAFVIHHLVAEDLAAGRLVRLALETRAALHMQAVTTRAAALSPVLQEVVQMIRAASGLLRGGAPAEAS